MGNPDHDGREEIAESQEEETSIQSTREASNAEGESRRDGEVLIGSDSAPQRTEPKLAVAEGHDKTEKVEEHITRGRRTSSESHARHSSESHHYYPGDEVHDAQVPPHRSISRTRSSQRSVRRDAVNVPVEERRGLLARFAIIPEVTEPYDYTPKQKWTITFIVAVAAAAAPMGSAIILPALSKIQAAFNAEPVIVNLSVALYMLSMSIFPLWWSSFSETLGRRTIYIASFTLFLIFNILAAVSVNITMFIITRLLAGGAAASVQAVGAGTIADIWEVKNRGKAMGYFYLGPLCSPLIAPFVGGALTLGLGWRAPQYFLAIFGLFTLVFIIVCLPETLRQRKSLAAAAEAEVIESVLDGEKGADETIGSALTRTSTRKSMNIKARKTVAMLRRALLDPLKIILYLRVPAVALCVFYASIIFGSLYVLNIAIEETFQNSPWNFSPLVVGLMYLPNSLGYFLASIFGGPWVDRIMHRQARKANRWMKEVVWFSYQKIDSLKIFTLRPFCSLLA
ncbi:hypothetical protein MRB53_039844 [Persea americana]|nr:hypothetical protein MRB53_039844 [Persea americana]